MTDDQRRRFDQVYAVHHAAILGYALRRTGNADDAADVIGETFLTAWRRIDDIPPPRPADRRGARRASRRLGDADREILTLAGWEGLDGGQIAVVLGCSRNAARIRLHRARRRFAAALHDTRTAFAPELIRGNS